VGTTGNKSLPVLKGIVIWLQNSNMKGYPEIP